MLRADGALVREAHTLDSPSLGLVPHATLLRVAERRRLLPPLPAPVASPTAAVAATTVAAGGEEEGGEGEEEGGASGGGGDGGDGGPTGAAAGVGTMRLRIVGPGAWAGWASEKVCI